MRAPHPRSILVGACLGTLAANALMTWQIFQPLPLQVIVAMSVGQALGTAALAAYLYVVVRDLRAARKAAREALDKITPEE